MKVGTDGVLLGAWAELPADVPDECCRVLDVGTGSGLIALMLAQRFHRATITGIDIDTETVEQANINFIHSDWSDRLDAYNVSLQDLVKNNSEESFDLIVSNPPFFSSGPDAGNFKRTLARRTDLLTLEELVSCSATILRYGGYFSVILPAWEKDNILSVTTNYNLLLNRCLHIKGRENKPVKRILFEFIKCRGDELTCKHKELQSEPLLVLEDGINSRTEQYKELTKEFYL